MNSASESSADLRPLFVKLDGVVVRTNVFVESVFALLKKQISAIGWMLRWSLKGQANLKAQIAERTEIDVQTLPFNRPFLEFLKGEAAAGRELILVTSSNVALAKSIVDHLGIFKDILASDAESNLVGRDLVDRIQASAGASEFVYAGNGQDDQEIWKHAAGAILVDPRSDVERTLGGRVPVVRRFEDPQFDSLTNYLRAVRLHQWLKNLLVFVPITLAHHLNDFSAILQATLAFLSFCLCASSVYLLNDLLDLQDDRHHSTKCQRPFAAGSIRLLHGVFAVPILLAASIVLALFLPLKFAGILGLYYVSTLAYSFFLKRAAPIDVLLLAGLFTLRILAGAAAISVFPSFWLLAFSMFLFLSLALVKRCSEISSRTNSTDVKIAGRGYRTSDLETLSQLGGASGYMAVMVLALYINSEEVKLLYNNPEYIWLICPILLYMMTRIWLLTRRNEMKEDPVVFFIKDKRSLALTLISVFLLFLATQ